MLQTQTSPKLELRKIVRESYDDYYFTVINTTDGPVNELVEAMYAQVLEVLRTEQVQIFQEKILGSSSVREEFHMCRKALMQLYELESESPYTFVEGRPQDGQSLVGLQVWGIRAKTDVIEVHTDYDTMTPARVWKGPGYKYVYFPAIHGLDDAIPENTVCVHGQCSKMFARASQGLERFGMSFKDVARTWIYSARLLDWYGELNRVRTEHFKKVGLYASEQRPAFPASTGIQGKHGMEECFFDVFALQSDAAETVKMTPVNASARQDQAFDYGSSFSRAMLVEQEGCKALYISGTAAINHLGESIYIGDTEMQTLNTLMNIAALIEDQGGTLADIVYGTVYCKNHEAYEAYKRTLQLLRIPEMPLVCVGADVCRHELLIEIEAVAVVRS